MNDWCIISRLHCSSEFGDWVGIEKFPSREDALNAFYDYRPESYNHEISVGIFDNYASYFGDVLSEGDEYTVLRKEPCVSDNGQSFYRVSLEKRKAPRPFTREFTGYESCECKECLISSGRAWDDTSVSSHPLSDNLALIRP